MQAGLAGDEVAYRSLLGAITPYVRAVARRAVTRSHVGIDVEDIVQDVLLAVHLKRHMWNPALPLAPWLGAVTRHKTIDALRRSGRHAAVPIEDFEQVLAGPAPEPSDHGDTEKMLSFLPDKQRAIIRGMTMNGRSAAELGRELGMSEGAVRVSLHRALKMLSANFGGGRR